MIFRVTLSDHAFEYYAEVLHKRSKRAQKDHSIFSVTHFVRVEAHNSAKGLSTDLEQFFCPPHPQVLSSEYYSQQTRLIRPDSFMDMREDKIYEYEQWGYPGKEAEVFLPGYTTWWVLENPRTQHQLVLPTAKILTALYEIGKYWHIGGPGFRPRSAHEIQTSTLEAIGIGYLRHPLLPTPHKYAVGSIEK